jgi:hypothetical protein
MGMLESEGDGLPGVRVSPPWPYLIRLPLLRVVPAMRNKRVYKLTQNAGFVKGGGTADGNVIREAGWPEWIQPNGGLPGARVRPPSRASAKRPPTVR